MLNDNSKAGLSSQAWLQKQTIQWQNAMQVIPKIRKRKHPEINGNHCTLQANTFSAPTLQALMPTLSVWGENIQDTNLKAQMLCLFAKADVLLSKYAPDAQDMLRHALNTIPKDAYIESSSKIQAPKQAQMQAHIYQTIADCLKHNLAFAEQSAPILYDKAKTTFTSQSRQYGPGDTQAIITQFTNESRKILALLPNGATDRTPWRTIAPNYKHYFRST